MSRDALTASRDIPVRGDVVLGCHGAVPDAPVFSGLVYFAEIHGFLIAHARAQRVYKSRAERVKPCTHTSTRGRA